MALKIGVIAEEHNDIDVIYQLTCRLTPENTFTFSRRVAHGCGRLANKCQSWSRDLVRRGCTHLIVIHDLDDKDQNTLIIKVKKQSIIGYKEDKMDFDRFMEQAEITQY